MSARLLVSGEATEMGLCEYRQVMLYPDRLYIFRVMPGCEKCKAQIPPPPPGFESGSDPGWKQGEVKS